MVLERYAELLTVLNRNAEAERLRARVRQIREGFAATTGAADEQTK